MDYRDIICESFLHRRRLNPRYSMRAFARDINISASHLSEVLSGKSELSLFKGKAIAKGLKLLPLQSADFLDLIEAKTAPQKIQRQAAINRVRKRQAKVNHREFDNDEFANIADPQYLLTWSFMQLPAYDGDSLKITKHLKLNAIEVFQILQRLERLGLVERKGHLWFAIDCQFTVGDRAPSEALRSYHRAMSLLGRKAIDGQPMNARHLDSLVMPFDCKRFGEVQQRIANFTQSLIDEFGHNGDAVYGMTLQFFRMSEPLPP